MQWIRNRLTFALIGGVLGKLASDAIRRRTRRYVSGLPHKATDIFVSERTISPFGRHHRPDEPPFEAAARIIHTRVIGHEPSPDARRAFAAMIEVGVLLASAWALVAVVRRRGALRSGLLAGTGIWLVIDEIAFPLLGLADKPTVYSPTQHAQLLAERLGFGVVAAASTRALESVYE